MNARRYVALLVALALSLALVAGVAGSAVPTHCWAPDDQGDPEITLGKDNEDITGDDDRWGTTSVWSGENESSDDPEETGGADPKSGKGPELVSPHGILRDGIRIFVGTVWVLLSCAL